MSRAYRAGLEEMRAAVTKSLLCLTESVVDRPRVPLRTMGKTLHRLQNGVERPVALVLKRFMAMAMNRVNLGVEGSLERTPLHLLVCAAVTTMTTQPVRLGVQESVKKGL